MELEVQEETGGVRASFPGDCIASTDRSAMRAHHVAMWEGTGGG